MRVLFFSKTPEIRFFARITDPNTLICNPHWSILDSAMLPLKIQSRFASWSNSIYLLLMSFALALSTRKTGVEIIIFDSGAYFCMNDFRSLIALNISLGVVWDASLVPTSKTILSGFFLKSGILKNLISPMVATGNVRTFIVFRSDILNFLRPDRIDCCLDFLSNLQYPSWNKLVQDSMLHLRYSGNHVGTFALDLWDLFIFDDMSVTIKLVIYNDIIRQAFLRFINYIKVAADKIFNRLIN